nr:MAG TPA: hypothetical protein [Caudoviricetes sp.]
MCLYVRGQNNGQLLTNANKSSYIFIHHAKKLFFLAFFKNSLYVCGVQHI